MSRFPTLFAPFPLLALVALASTLGLLSQGCKTHPRGTTVPHQAGNAANAAIAANQAHGAPSEAQLEPVAWPAGPKQGRIQQLLPPSHATPGGGWFVMLVPRDHMQLRQTVAPPWMQALAARGVKVARVAFRQRLSHAAKVGAVPKVLAVLWKEATLAKASKATILAGFGAEAATAAAVWLQSPRSYAGAALFSGAPYPLSVASAAAKRPEGNGTTANTPAAQPQLYLISEGSGAQAATQALAHRTLAKTLEQRAIQVHRLIVPKHDQRQLLDWQPLSMLGQELAQRLGSVDIQLLRVPQIETTSFPRRRESKGFAHVALLDARLRGHDEVENGQDPLQRAGRAECPQTLVTLLGDGNPGPRQAPTSTATSAPTPTQPNQGGGQSDQAAWPGHWYDDVLIWDRPKPPLNSREFWQAPELIVTKPVTPRLRSLVQRIFENTQHRLLAWPLATYRAIPLTAWLRHRFGQQSGHTIEITNARQERFRMTAAQVQQLQPQIVVGLDDEKELYRLVTSYASKRQYTWQEAPTPVRRVRPLGPFLYFPTEPPPALQQQSYASFALTYDGIRLHSEPPLGALEGLRASDARNSAATNKLSPALMQTLTYDSGCLTCHSLHGMGPKSGHLAVTDGRLVGGFALPLQTYPKPVMRDFLFNQDKVANTFGVRPIRVAPKVAHELLGLLHTPANPPSAEASELKPQRR